ncbi:hypothetical protein GCM10010946_04930 [Undibacterium squillarum]|uniref:Uncharacterized protein n=1 Tax=Undibacterium squillarum TaxID=1131567 RepID=A0ABQ2XRN0_9BURK|nr:hypothetical protein GCM10010946_04930 [Undibacterium squillarum]
MADLTSSARSFKARRINMQATCQKKGRILESLEVRIVNLNIYFPLLTKNYINVHFLLLQAEIAIKSSCVGADGIAPV